MKSIIYNPFIIIPTVSIVSAAVLACATMNRYAPPVVVHEDAKPKVIAVEYSQKSGEYKVATSEDRYIVTTSIGNLMTSATTTSATEAVSTTADFIQNVVYNISESDRELLYAVVELEGGVESKECKKAICSTIINRNLTDGLNYADMVLDPNQYSVAYSIYECIPSQESIDAVNDVLIGGTTLPIYVKSFRAEYYHDWGDQTPYINLGNTYFSYSAYERSLYE